MSRKATNFSPEAVARREKYQANKAAKQAAMGSVETPPVDTGAVEVEVAPNETPKLSLKDRLFGGQAPAPADTPKAKTAKKGQRGKQIDAGLLAKTAPTMLATLLAGYSQRLIHDPYKSCAPTKEEVYGILSPLFNILSRRVEIVGTASEDVIDLISSVIAGFTAGIRIHITYLSIQELMEKAKHNGYATAPTNGHATAPTSAGTVSNRSTGNNGAGIDTSQANPILDGLPRDYANAGNDDTTFEGGNSINAKPEATLFAELAKRDRSGRVRLGLLSG